MVARFIHSDFQYTQGKQGATLEAVAVKEQSGKEIPFA